jgi:hypothetical protein
MALPPYLARHVDLGFDSDDVSTLIDAIESSQTSTIDDNSPHLPAEIVLQILEYIPIDHVLSFRAVCRAFRNCIDTRVLYSYLPRTELLGFVRELPSHLIEHDRERLRWICATFSHLEDADGPMKYHGAKWAGTHAVFRLDDAWYDTFCLLNLTSNPHLQANQIIAELALERTPPTYTALGWLVKLDRGVLEVDLGKTDIQDLGMWVDFTSRTVKVKWKTMLTNFLKSETCLKSTVEDKTFSDFSFGHIEDCLRAVRRRRIRSLLDLDQREDRVLAWQLRVLPGLFGNTFRTKLEDSYILESAEHEAVRHILEWRKAASRTQRERDYLVQLAEDRRTMVKELGELNELFGDWKLNMYDPSSEAVSYEKVYREKLSIQPFARLPYNACVWSDEIIAWEEQRVRKWQSQRNMRKMITELLTVSNETLNVPEDAFDSFSSDI